MHSHGMHLYGKGQACVPHRSKRSFFFLLNLSSSILNTVRGPIGSAARKNINKQVNTNIFHFKSLEESTESDGEKRRERMEKEKKTG